MRLDKQETTGGRGPASKDIPVGPGPRTEQKNNASERPCLTWGPVWNGVAQAAAPSGVQAPNANPKGSSGPRSFPGAGVPGAGP